MIAKALSKKADARHQSCQDLLDDIELVRLRYPLVTQRATASGSPAGAENPAGPNGAARIDAVGLPDLPTMGAAPSTDDTVDSLPVGVFNSDDTVTLKPPSTWAQRVSDRIDSAISGVFARVWRPAAQNPPTPTGVRKR